MRIVIDLQGAQTESRFRGIGRYSMSLAVAMAKQAQLRGHDTWLCLNANLSDSIDAIRGTFDGLLPESQIKLFDALGPVSWPQPENRWRREASEMAREAFIAGLNPDVVHVSSLFEGAQDGAVLSVGKFSTRPPTAVTLYDLIPLLNREKYLATEWTHAWYMDRIASLRRADLLLSISDHARSEAIEALQLDQSRVVNMSSAVSDHFRPRQIGTDQRQFLLDRFGIRESYVMYSGAMEPRKNAEGLFQAFALLPESVRLSHRLVLAGKLAPDESQRLTQLAFDLGIRDRLVLTGYISDEELIVLYNAAALYIFPSFHEGFGLPALEAMACGTPTIGSNVTSIPEVIGRADALFDPYQPASIAEIVTRALTDADFNRSLRQHALAQAAKFSWAKTAECAIDAFERLPTSMRSLGRTGWRAANDGVRNLYPSLIGAIASIPAEPQELVEADLADLASAIAANQHRLDHVTRMGDLPERLSWRVEGPFDSSYSLAAVNRELAAALDALGHDVGLHSTEGPGDFDPSQTFLIEHPDIARLHARGTQLPESSVDVCSRLLYPPRVDDMQARINLLHLYAWEESGFPSEWVENFNDRLQGITCLSRHVEKIMLDNGVAVPLRVAGCGVDHWERVTAAEDFVIEGRKFRFLHVSSCFARKGVDALITAFGQAFSASDDVTLIIKTFANPHNQVHQWLHEARHGRPDFPDVVIIQDDISEAQLKALYEGCHALVAPSRAEGFGLPIAEAMLSGLPVITTGWGGQLDFCSPDTAWLVDYKFAPAQTHFGLSASVWAEPDMDSLVRAMVEVWHLPPELRRARSNKGRQALMDRFKWSDVAENQVESARQFAKTDVLEKPKIGWISSWNTKCGIATYSDNLIKHFDNSVDIFASHTDVLTWADGPEVRRCWHSSRDDDLEMLSDSVNAAAPDVIVIQFQYAFFDFVALDHFIRHQVEAGRSVCVMMHATMDAPTTPRKRLARLADALNLCDRVLVHSYRDMNRLKAVNVIDNVALFPHGVMDWLPPEQPAKRHEFLVASYGFFLPHKGLIELIEAVELLRSEGREIALRMINAEYPVAESRDQIELAKSRIAELGMSDHVMLYTDFLADEQSLSLLSDADVVVFPYQGTGESASGAVRYGLASGRTVAVTPLHIFDDLGEAVLRLPGRSVSAIAEGLRAVMDSPESSDLAKVRETALSWRNAHRYSTLSRRLITMLGQVVRRRRERRPDS